MILTIVNQQGHNFGDEAAGCALVERLRRYSQVSKINVLYASDSPLPIYSPDVYHHLDCSLRNVGILRVLIFLVFGIVPAKKTTKSQCLVKWIKILKESSYVFVSPCGASIGKYRDWRYILRLLIAVKSGIHLQFHYNTIGNSGSLLFDKLSYIVLTHATIRVREKVSQQYLKSIGLESEIGPDSAFILPSISVANKSVLIGFIPAEFSSWHPDFRKSKIEAVVKQKIYLPIINYVKNSHYTLLLIPHFNNEQKTGFCAKIRDELIKLGMEPQKIIVAKNVKNCYDYDNVISKCKIIIGMRYHSIILSAKNGIPFVSLSYEYKMKEVCRYCNMDAFTIDLASLEHQPKEKLISLIYKIEEEYECIKNKLLITSTKLKKKFENDSIERLMKN
jgi:colanic acid/amylovoran biosynthesis protein